MEHPWPKPSSDGLKTTGGRGVSSRNEKLAWFGVIALAVVAFEATADPALSTALGCLKFGWNEVRLARWLKRTDPDRKRGRICSRFYLAWGLWRVSLVATAMMFVIAFAYAAIEGKPANGGMRAGPPPGFVTAFFLALAGFVLSSMVSSLAVISALRHRVRVWLGPEASWARAEKIWPPHAVARRRETSNRTKTILLSALITGLMFGLLFVLLPSRTPSGPQGGALGPNVPSVIPHVFSVFCGPILILACWISSEPG